VNGYPPLSPVDKTLHVPEGYLYRQYSAASRESANPDNSWAERLGWGVLGAVAGPVALAEEYLVRPLMNVPFAMESAGIQIGERSARMSQPWQRGEYGDAVVAGLHIVKSGSEGTVAGLSVGIPVAGVLENRATAATVAAVDEAAAAAAGEAPGGSVGAMRRLVQFDEATSALRHQPGVARPASNAGPINGQGALDLSVGISERTTRRVGIDYARSEFVVFDEHMPGVFHGHVRSWEELTQAMQSALRRADMVNSKGRILMGAK
jgi:hypothetical protein